MPTVTLNWKDDNFGESEHRVYRSSTTIDPANPGTPLATLGANIETYADTTVVDQTTYYYRVSAMVNGTEYVGAEQSIFIDSPNIPTSGLMVFYSMDNISGSTLVDDSPNGRNGTISGATQVAGQVGQALNFDGVNDIVSIPVSALPTNGEISVCAWLNHDSDGGNSFYFEDSVFGRQLNLHSWFSDNNLYFDCGGDGNGNTDFDRISGTLPVDKRTGWHFFIVSKSVATGEMWVYVDDVELLYGTGKTRAIQVPDYGTMGANSPSTAGANWDGRTDQFRIYNRLLTPAERNALYLEA